MVNLMYQIRLRLYGTWQMTTWQRGEGPRLTDHPVIGKEVLPLWLTLTSQLDSGLAFSAVCMPRNMHVNPPPQTSTSRPDSPEITPSRS